MSFASRGRVFIVRDSCWLVVSPILLQYLRTLGASVVWRNCSFRFHGPLPPQNPCFCSPRASWRNEASFVFFRFEDTTHNTRSILFVTHACARSMAHLHRGIKLLVAYSTSSTTDLSSSSLANTFPLLKLLQIVWKRDQILPVPNRCSLPLVWAPLPNLIHSPSCSPTERSPAGCRNGSTWPTIYHVWNVSEILLLNALKSTHCASWVWEEDAPQLPSPPCVLLNSSVLLSSAEWVSSLCNHAISWLPRLTWPVDFIFGSSGRLSATLLLAQFEFYHAQVAACSLSSVTFASL